MNDKHGKILMIIKITVLKEKSSDSEEYEILESVCKNCWSSQNVSANMAIKI